MTYDDLTTTTDSTDRPQGDILITLGSRRGVRIEMTLANRMQLEREMARTLDNPLDALMTEVTNEYRQMSPARSGPGLRLV